MSAELPDILTAHVRQLRDEAPMVWLYEFQVLTEPRTRLRLTNYGQSISYGTSSDGSPLVYDAAPLVHGPIEHSAEGDQPGFQVQIGNSGLDLAQLLEDYDGFNGSEARVLLVNGQALDLPPVLDFVCEVLGVRVDAKLATVSLGLDNLAAIQAPPERYQRDHCRFAYGSPRCGAQTNVSALTAIVPACARTHAACEEVGAAELAVGLPVLHPVRFGGWLGIPRRSRR